MEPWLYSLEHFLVNPNVLEMWQLQLIFFEEQNHSSATFCLKFVVLGYVSCKIVIRKQIFHS